MRFKTEKLKYIFPCIAVGLMVQLFQNCGQFDGGFHGLSESSFASSSSALDISHPATDSATPPSQKTLLVNRTYVAELLRDIFTSASHPVPNLETYVQQWVYTRGAQYGQGCNPYDTYTGLDCGGDISNSNLATYQDNSTMRESFHLQACEGILGTDEAVYAALEKLSIDPTRTAPTAASIAGAFDLFYRGRDLSSDVASSLMQLDQALNAAGETPFERWRGVTLQICESTDWEML